MTKTLFFKQIFASILIIFFILLSWKFTFNLWCFSLLIPILIMFVLASSFIELKMNQKKCFRNCYFKENTLVSKVLTSPFFTIIFFLILSFSYTMTLMYNILTFEKIFYFIIVSFIVLTFLIFRFFIKIFRNIVNEVHLEIFAREVTAKITAFILFCIYFYLILNSYEPEYLKQTAIQTANAASNSIASNCKISDLILRFQAEISSQVWFLIKESNSLIPKDIMKTILWLAFIFINALSVLGLNRFIVQVIYLVNKLMKKDSEKSNEQ